MPKSQTPRFSEETLKFLEKAGRQRNPTWLDRNRAEFELHVKEPLQAFARELKSELSPLAPGYHFPLKGIGRIKRSAHRVEAGAGLYKDWMSYQASTPAVSRFDHNPNLFFLIQPGDSDDPILVAGGLYMPSSRQLRSLREAIAEDASAFEELFATKDFSSRFKGGFSNERTSSRPPRGFDPNHPKMHWLKLQAYFVWRPYTVREFKSPGFAALVARDMKQILKLNLLLDQALQGRLPKKVPKLKKPTQLLERLTDFNHATRKMDF